MQDLKNYRTLPTDDGKGNMPAIVWLGRSNREGRYRGTNVPLETSQHERYPTINPAHSGIGAQIMPAILEHSGGYKARTGFSNLRHGIEMSVGECLGPHFRYQVERRAEVGFTLTNLLRKTGQEIESGSIPLAIADSFVALQVAHDFLHQAVGHLKMNRDINFGSGPTRNESSLSENIRFVEYFAVLANDLKLFACHGECPKVRTFMTNAAAIDEIGQKLNSMYRECKRRQQTLGELQYPGTLVEQKLLYDKALEERASQEHHLITTALDAALALTIDIRDNAFSLPRRDLQDRFNTTAADYLSASLEPLCISLAAFEKRTKLQAV